MSFRWRYSFCGVMTWILWLGMCLASVMFMMRLCVTYQHGILWIVLFSARLLVWYLKDRLAKAHKPTGSLTDLRGWNACYVEVRLVFTFSYPDSLNLQSLTTSLFVNLITYNKVSLHWNSLHPKFGHCYVWVTSATVVTAT